MTLLLALASFIAGSAIGYLIWGLPAGGMAEEITHLRQINDTLRRRISPFDHDGDGSPGGSVKRPVSTRV